MGRADRSPQESAWLTMRETAASSRTRRRREWAQLLELGILLLALCGGAFVLYKVLLLFG